MKLMSLGAPTAGGPGVVSVGVEAASICVNELGPSPFEAAISIITWITESVSSSIWCCRS